ncbi:MAG: ATP-binding protein [Chloroflexota bacterium]
MNIRRHSTISEEELTARLQSGQNERTAFFADNASIRSVAETLTAMANTNGGILVLGVNKRGVIQESVDINRVRETAANAMLQTEPPLILPSPQTFELTPGAWGRGDVIVLTVPPGLPHLYSTQGRYLARTSTKNRSLQPNELRSLLLERGDSGFESIPADGTTIHYLDSRRVERYLHQIEAAPDEDTVQLLISKGCLAEGASESPADEVLEDQGQDSDRMAMPTMAGILLFGQDPQQIVRSAEIICVRYAGESMGDEFVRQDIQGVLPEQIRQAEAFIVSNMRRGMTLNGLSRDETTEYPVAVVREAIVNAIAHRDYSIRGEGIRIFMFSDRMEVYSPGRLPGHVTLDNLVNERYSRNEAIVAVLTDLGYIERLGYGIDRMIATMNENGLEAPLFEETAAGFRVTLQSAGGKIVGSQPEKQPWHSGGLTPRQEQAIRFVHEQGRITNGDYQALVPDVSAETIRRDLADLVNKNLLIRVGSKKTTYYILK